MSATMTAAEVRECLSLRWPDSEYLHIPEAPQYSDRGGRKLDVLVVSLWRSRGLQREGVEIKVSVSDWTREVKNAEKADWWWRHVNRFWVAVPAAIEDRVREGLPPTWGLLSCEHGKAPRVVTKAPSREVVETFTWAETVGLMRAASDSGASALARAERRGRDEGYQRGKETAERQSRDGTAARELQALRERVRSFEEASGLRLDTSWPDPAETGRLVALVEKERALPGWLAQGIGRSAQQVAEDARRLTKMAEDAQGAAERIARIVNGAADRAAP